MKKIWIALIITLLISTGCSGNQIINQVPTIDAFQIYTQAASTVQAQITAAFLQTPSATVTLTPEPTATETPTPTVTPEPTEPWSQVASGNVKAVILLYTHITDDKKDNPYLQNDSRIDVPSEDFRKQMAAFKSAGYETISLAKLIDTIYFGGDMPPKPLIVTFDGATAGIYKKAFPILQELGYTGTVFLVAGRMQEGIGVITVEQAKELAAAGWEIGSKGMYGGINLVNSYGDTGVEAGQSKALLEERIGVPVDIFAYPFGAMNEQVALKISNYGYKGAAGLGKSVDHGWNSIFYLSRLEITTETKLDELNALIPWPIEYAGEGSSPQSGSESETPVGETGSGDDGEIGSGDITATP